MLAPIPWSFRRRPGPTPLGTAKLGAAKSAVRSGE
jgi:hypothetical protein